MAKQYVSTTLYDGPLVVDLPASFEDISEQRGAEDTEFVFGDKHSFTTIIFDILTRVSLPSEDLKSSIPPSQLLALEEAAAMAGRELEAKDISPAIDADIDALLFHLEDIMEIRDEISKMSSDAEREAAKNEIDIVEVWEAPRKVQMLHVNQPCFTMTAKMTRNPKSTKRRRPEDPDFTVVMVTLIRLVEQDADVVVAVNVPLRGGEYVPGKERECGLVKGGREIVERVWSSLEVRGSFY